MSSTELRKIARFPNYVIAENGSITSILTNKVVQTRGERNRHTGEVVKKVLLYSSRTGYSVEAFVSELHRAAWPELYSEPTKTHVPGLSGLPGRLAA